MLRLGRAGELDARGRESSLADKPGNWFATEEFADRELVDTIFLFLAAAGIADNEGRTPLGLFDGMAV